MVLSVGVFVETSMSWAGSDAGRHRAAISERKVSWHVCVSGSSVGQSASLVVFKLHGPGFGSRWDAGFLVAVCWTSHFCD